MERVVAFCYHPEWGARQAIVLLMRMGSASTSANCTSVSRATSHAMGQKAGNALQRSAVPNWVALWLRYHCEVSTVE
jgi:hypothetical protein